MQTQLENFARGRVSQHRIPRGWRRRYARAPPLLLLLVPSGSRLLPVHFLPSWLCPHPAQPQTGFLFFFYFIFYFPHKHAVTRSLPPPQRCPSSSQGCRVPLPCRGCFSQPQTHPDTSLPSSSSSRRGAGMGHDAVSGSVQEEEPSSSSAPAGGCGRWVPRRDTRGRRWLRAVGVQQGGKGSQHVATRVSDTLALGCVGCLARWACVVCAPEAGLGLCSGQDACATSVPPRRMRSGWRRAKRAACTTVMQSLNPQVGFILRDSGVSLWLETPTCGWWVPHRAVGAARGRGCKAMGRARVHGRTCARTWVCTPLSSGAWAATSSPGRAARGGAFNYFNRILRKERAWAANLKGFVPCGGAERF